MEPEVSDDPEGDRKIATFVLHGCVLYKFRGEPRILTQAPTEGYPMLRGGVGFRRTDKRDWDATTMGLNHKNYQGEFPWSELRREQLASLEWSLIEQFLRLVNAT